MNSELREEIKQSLKTSIRHYIEKFSYGAATQPLDLLIPRERKIRSVVGGLETSMGTTVWEPMAKKLAQQNGFEVITEKINKPEPMPLELASELAVLISLRETRATWVNAEECRERIRNVCSKLSLNDTQYISPPAGTGVDIYLKKDNKYYAFDTKTVQPNLGSIKSFNKQILEWYAYSLCKDPTIDIKCMIAYPYNPYQDNFWSHSPHTLGVLEPKVDALVEDEFWDFLSGFSGTYEEIVKILTELRDEGFGKELSVLIEKINTPLE